VDPVATGHDLDCAAAEALGGRICAAAAQTAQAECQLLELIGEFDAGNAVRWWDGVSSLAHWLSWACSMAPGTAREHVRVARALRRMPTTRAAFAEGRLSYSKVREMTRVADTVAESELCELAQRATAAQLAKTVAGYRTAAGARIRQERERTLTWTVRESGVVDLRVRLPKDQAAVLLAAIAAAQDQFGPQRDPGTAGGTASDGPDRATAEVDEVDEVADRSTPAYTRVDALLDVARTFVSRTPEDRSGEDRSLVVVHVGLDQLSSAGDARDVPAGTREARTPTSDPRESVAVEPGSASSGAPQPGVSRPSPTDSSPADPSPTRTEAEPTCHIQGIGGIERETARRIACDSEVLGAIIDTHGDVLALGRSRRLVSRAQRRALMIRDRGLCQFTGCHRSHHLKAHHVIHWADGGPTDLDNLLLLCQFHHTAVHEGQMLVQRADHRTWTFLMPDGSPHRDWHTAEGLSSFLARHAEQAVNQGADPVREPSLIERVRLEGVDSFHHPDAQRIQPGWRGEPYDRHEAVQALFRMPVRAPAAAAA
jgi:5-methylcytosine-specific restriction endonuclease McrA